MSSEFFEHVLDPLPPAVFFAEYWQKKALHISRKSRTLNPPPTSASSSSSSPDSSPKKASSSFSTTAVGSTYYDEFFNLGDIEELWSNASMSCQGTLAAKKLNKNNEEEEEEKEEGEDDDNEEEERHKTMEQFADAVLIFYKDRGQVQVASNCSFAYALGCSVVVNRGDRYSRSIYRMCRMLESNRFPFVFCNVYLTPKGSQTVPSHTDDREVILLQIYGKKKWTINTCPIAYPYRYEEFGKPHGIAYNEFTDPLPVTLSCVLEPGDLLYIPRGFVHVASTLDDEPSFHLTFAFQTSDWDVGTLFSYALSQQMLPQIASSRLPVPFELMADTSRERWSERCEKEEEQKEKAEADEGEGKVGEKETTAPMQQLESQVQHLVSDMNAKIDVPKMYEMFCKRLAGIRAERDSYRHRAQFALVSHPLTPTTQLLWNSAIRLVHQDSIKDKQFDCVCSILIFERSAPEKGTMRLAVSRPIIHALEFVHDKHKKIPICLGEVPIGDARDMIKKMALCMQLLRNGCLLRVT